jgi:hypothetical protein
MARRRTHMMGTPGILRMRRLRSCGGKKRESMSFCHHHHHQQQQQQLLALSQVATMKQRCCVQRSTKQSSAYLHAEAINALRSLCLCGGRRGQSRSLVLARQPLEARVACDAQRHFILGAKFFKLGHDAIAGGV